MEVVDLPLAGLKLVRPRVFPDERGFFLEPYNEPRYVAAGIGARFVQDNHSRSVGGTLRGLHYQRHPGQAKLVRVSLGRILDVAVDIRPSSSTFGRWHAVELDATAHVQLFVPIGFAHGFYVLSEVAEVQYKVTSVYDPKEEHTLAWDDPEIAVAWPDPSPKLSPRDCAGESFAQYRLRVSS